MIFFYFGFFFSTVEIIEIIQTVLKATPANTEETCSERRVLLISYSKFLVQGDTFGDFDLFALDKQKFFPPVWSAAVSFYEGGNLAQFYARLCTIDPTPVLTLLDV